MRLLLDTHILLWAMTLDPRLPKSIAAAVRSGSNDVAVSAVSVWEVTIKRMRGRLEMEVDDLLMTLSAEGFEELPVRFGHILNLSLLPNHHRDPFDRILIAQSLAERRRLVTTDSRVLRYTDVPGFDPLTA